MIFLSEIRKNTIKNSTPRPPVTSLGGTLSPAFPFVFPVPAHQSFQAGIIEDLQFLAVFQRRLPEVFFEFSYKKTGVLVAAFFGNVFDRKRIAPQQLGGIFHPGGDQILERRTVQLPVEHPVERTLPDLEMFRHPFQREVRLNTFDSFSRPITRTRIIIMVTYFVTVLTTLRLCRHIFV